VNERVLVTGAAGFLGQHLLSLLENHQGKLWGTYLKGVPVQRLSFVDYVPLNVLRKESVRELFNQVRPDWVFHLAAMTIPRQSWKDIEGTFEANVRGTLNILDAARLQKERPRIFFASTIQVYGQSFYAPGALDEEAILWPGSPYAASKAVAELAILDYVRRFEIDALIGRFANSIGQGQPAALVFPEWCAQIASFERGLRPADLCTGNLEVQRDFLHARDTARAMLSIMRKGRRGQVYNVASGKTEKLKAYAEYLLRKARVKVQLKPASSGKFKTEPRSMAINIKKLKRLGWKPKSRVETGLDELLQEWRRQKAG